MFSIGLMSVILFRYKLFTGKAGLLATHDIKSWELIKIWFGNLLGILCMSIIVLASPNSQVIEEKCLAIMQARQAAGFLPSILLAIPCGMLMYMAVSVSKNPMQLLYVGMCVAAFIMGGFYHCIADMFYTLAGAVNAHQYCNIFFVTLGNLIGCNLIPVIKRIEGE